MSIRSDHHPDFDETAFPAIVAAFLLIAFAGLLIYLQMFYFT